MKTPALLAAVLAALSLSAAAAQETSERLSGEQIRSRVIGRDITDEIHWWRYLRADGALVSIDLGREQVGRWRVEDDLLCMSEESAAETECFQVWVRDDKVTLRLDDGRTELVGFIRKHEGG